jgi:hypothetical protein
MGDKISVRELIGFLWTEAAPRIAWGLVIGAFFATAAGGMWFYCSELLSASDAVLKKWSDRGSAVAPFVGVLNVLSVLGALWALHLQRVALAKAREETAVDRRLQVDASELAAGSTMAGVYGDALARVDRIADPEEHMRLTGLLNKEIAGIRAVQLRIFERRGSTGAIERTGWIDPKADARKEWSRGSKLNG